MNAKNKKVLWIIGVVFLISVLAISIFASTHKKKPVVPYGEYYDANSKQTVSNPSGKAPDNYGAESQMPIFLGIDKLLDYGVTFDQVSAIKVGFYKYSYTQKKDIKEVSVGVDSIKTEKPVNPEQAFKISFKTIFNRKDTVLAKVEYSDLSKARLYIYNESGQLLYDSGLIDSNNTAGE